MATMVCHPNLQPCLDSQFIETTWPPRINFKSPFQFLAFNSSFLKLDLDSSQSLEYQCDDLSNRNLTISVPPPTPPSVCRNKSDADAEAKSPMAIKELQSPYVHRSRSTLSEKSLAICTEDLGCETGAADFVDDSVFSDLKIERSPIRKRVKSDSQGNKKLFPPPLTTIAGVDSIRVRSYREDGRLIMEAVTAPAMLSYFHAERSHGRLRLSILKSTAPEVEEEESTEEEEEELKIRNDDVEAVGEKGNCEENVGGKVEENGNIRGAEIEIEKIERPCRCKEAGGNSNYNIDENKNNNDILLWTREPLSIWVSKS